jgi:hypothetical protein
MAVNLRRRILCDRAVWFMFDAVDSIFLFSFFFFLGVECGRRHHRTG